MKKITISVVFNEWGNGFIQIVPSDYPQWKPNQSSSQDFELEPGDYSVTYMTSTGNGGSITVTENDNQLASCKLKPNDDAGSLDITVV